MLGLLVSSGFYFLLQSVHGNEFPGSCKYQFPLWWSAGAPCGTSDGPATGISSFLLTWRACALSSTWGNCHPPSSSTDSAAGAGDGPSLASGHTAVKLPAMKTAGLKEKYKVPFETKHATSSSSRMMDLHQFHAQLLQPRLRQELSEPWQCPDRFLLGLLYILQTALCCIPVGTKAVAT